jgi:hypothetical protein
MSSGQKRSRGVSTVVAIMCKNEEDNIIKTLNSCLGAIHKIFIYDTGSTDLTISLIKEWEKVNGMQVFIKEGIFENYSESRNVMLDWVDDNSESIDFILLMDANDELKNHVDFRKWINAQYRIPTGQTGFTFSQKWEVKSMNRITEYTNIRLIRPKSGWRYVRRIHETLTTTPDNIYQSCTSIGSAPKTFLLYQDRDDDDKKSSKRFESDVVMLLKDLEDFPNDPRTLYYLGQTYGCLADWDNCYKYYKMRSKVSNPANIEEDFLTCHQLGDITTRMIPGESNFDGERVKDPKMWGTALKWFVQAHSILKRAEPLVFIANWYIKHKDFAMAEGYAKLACELDYPKNTFMSVDSTIYDYKRWSHYAISGYFNGHFDDVIEASTRAYQYSKSSADAEVQAAILEKCPDYKHRIKAEWIADWKDKNCKGKHIPEKIANSEAEKAWTNQIDEIKNKNQIEKD